MKERKSYIAERLRKFKKQSSQNIVFIQKALCTKPNTSNIQGLIRLVDNSFYKKQENIKAKCEVMQAKFNTKAQKRFDQTFEQNGSYSQILEIEPQTMNTQKKIKNCDLKIQFLQESLVKIIQIIQNYQEYQKENLRYKQKQKKSMQSLLNISQISEHTLKCQEDNQLSQQLDFNRTRMINHEINLIEQQDLKNQYQQKIRQLETKNKKEIEQIKQKYLLQIQQVKDIQNRLQSANDELKKKLEKIQQRFEETNKKLSIQANKNSFFSFKITRCQQSISKFQQQKQQFKIKLISLQNQLSTQKDTKELTLNSIKMKEKKIFQLLNEYFTNKQQQKARADRTFNLETAENNIWGSIKSIWQKQKKTFKSNQQEQLTPMQTQYKQINVKNTKQSQEEQLRSDRIKELESELENAQDRIKSVQNRNKNIQQDLKVKDIEMSKKYNQIIQKSIKESKNVKQRFEKIVKSYQSQREEREGMIEKLTKICLHLEAEKQQLQSELKVMKKEYNQIVEQQVKKAQLAVRSLISNRDQLLLQNSKIQKKLIPLEKDIQFFKDQNKQITQYNNDLKLQLKDLNAKLSSLQNINQQLENTFKKFQDQLKIYHNQIIEIKQQKQIEKHQYTNQIQKLTDALREIQRDKSNKNNSSLIITPLTVSPILEGNLQKRRILIKQIQKFTKGTVVKSQIKYKFDQYSLNFSHYVNKQAFPILVLFKLTRNKNIIGAFCTSISNVNCKESGNAFIFSLQNGKLFTKLQGGYAQGARYADSMLIFGNSELYIKNNSSDKVLKLNVNMIGARYFSINNAQSLLGYVNQGNQVKFEQMQIHRIYYA